MNFDDVKEMCRKHTESLDKIRTIQYANKQRIWVKVIDARGGEFYLDDDEIELLEKFIDEKRLKIEKTIKELLGENN